MATAPEQWRRYSNETLRGLERGRHHRLASALSRHEQTPPHGRKEKDWAGLEPATVTPCTTFEASQLLGLDPCRGASTNSATSPKIIAASGASHSGSRPASCERASRSLPAQCWLEPGFELNRRAGQTPGAMLQSCLQGRSERAGRHSGCRGVCTPLDGLKCNHVTVGLRYDCVLAKHLSGQSLSPPPLSSALRIQRTKTTIGLA